MHNLKCVIGQGDRDTCCWVNDQIVWSPPVHIKRNFLPHISLNMDVIVKGKFLLLLQRGLIALN